MRANKIIDVLEKFKVSNYYQKILISGDWGIGKTKYILDFKRDDPNVCYVSLFGKKDIESVMQEIYSYMIENERMKKGVDAIRKKLEEVTVGVHGISISVPLIADLNSTLHKELEKRPLFIIIFDDLERKHPDLNIREIFGLIDALSNLNNIKTVLVAAKDKIEEDKETFTSYQEKAVDRTYHITTFAEDAPLEILSEEVWTVLKEHINNFNFTNLRTFEKTAAFIKEVIENIGEECFTDRFTKADLYRICFATVLFRVEHKSEMILLESDGPKSKHDDYKNSIYSYGEEGVINYIYYQILKSSLDNIMSKNIMIHILNWYDTGAYPEKITNVLEAINSFEEEPGNFYSSEQEILEVIDYCRNYIKSLNEEERIENIISKLSVAFSWCDILDVNFGISNEEIMVNIRSNITNTINLNESQFHNEISLFQIHTESKRGKELIFLVNEALKIEYQKQLLREIKESFNEGSYNMLLLRNLSDIVFTISDTETQKKFIDNFKENQYFFPLPIGKITEDYWFWCHQINKILKDINSSWGGQDYYKEFTQCIYNLIDGKEDKLLEYRVSSLFKENT